MDYFPELADIYFGGISAGLIRVHTFSQLMTQGATVTVPVPRSGVIHEIDESDLIADMELNDEMGETDETDEMDDMDEMEVQ